MNNTLALEFLFVFMWKLYVETDIACYFFYYLYFPLSLYFFPYLKAVKELYVFNISMFT